MHLGSNMIEVSIIFWRWLNWGRRVCPKSINDKTTNLYCFKMCCPSTFLFPAGWWIPFFSLSFFFCVCLWSGLGGGWGCCTWIPKLYFISDTVGSGFTTWFGVSSHKIFLCLVDKPVTQIFCLHVSVELLNCSEISSYFHVYYSFLRKLHVPPSPVCPFLLPIHILLYAGCYIVQSCSTV